jgi:hypothetical protein
MKLSEKLRDQIIHLMEDQIRDNNPAEVKETFERLIHMGYDEYQARELIIRCLIMEVYDALSNDHIFNEKRYIKNLSKLPNGPEDF